MLSQECNVAITSNLLGSADERLVFSSSCLAHSHAEKLKKKGSVFRVNALALAAAFPITRTKGLTV